ncbi:MAG: SRPBCC family protein [Proteobacteria bacterium]|nr:SRPBCC family protein [Pseudomonadota bacterium]
MNEALATITRVITQRVACDWRRAWTLAADPLRMPEWASGLSSGHFTRDGAHWRFETAEGSRARIRFAPANDFGVLDHWVTPEESPGAAEIYLPFRVIGLAEGLCEFQFTLIRQPTMDDAAFERDARWIANDLRALRDLLEMPATA